MHTGADTVLSEKGLWSLFSKEGLPPWTVWILPLLQTMRTMIETHSNVTPDSAPNLANAFS